MALFQKGGDAGFGTVAVQNQFSLFNGVYLYFMKVNKSSLEKATRAHHRRKANLAEVIVLLYGLDPNFLAWLLPHCLEMSRPSFPLQTFSVVFSALLQVDFHKIQGRDVSLYMAAGLRLSTGFSRIWDGLLEHGTTHFSISSNSVFHFSDSENEAFKAEIARLYWMQNHPFSALSYSLQ